MSTTTDAEGSTDASIAAGLAAGPLQAGRVQDELQRHVPEFAAPT